MNSKLFAFNVAQEVPATATETVVGQYDAQQQIWVGAQGVGLYTPTETISRYTVRCYYGTGICVNDEEYDSDRD